MNDPHTPNKRDCHSRFKKHQQTIYCLKKKTQQLYIKTKVKSNISKPNPTAYKNNYIPQPSGIYLMYTRLVHHLKINNVLYHTNRQRKKKSHIITPKNAQKGI